MAYTGTAYGDITPRQAAFSMAGFLSRAIPNMTIERFGQAFVVPTNNTQTAKFRRYYLPAPPAPPAAAPVRTRIRPR